MFEKPVVKTFQYGNHTVTLETGVIARQATAAVMVTMDDTAVFVSVVGKKYSRTRSKMKCKLLQRLYL